MTNNPVVFTAESGKEIKLLDFYKHCIDSACEDYFSDDKCFGIICRLLAKASDDGVYKNVVSYFARVHPLQHQFFNKVFEDAYTKHKENKNG